MKLVAVILFVTFGVCASGSQLGECAWGPSYWCSRIQHAKQCGAVQHCMTTVWKYQINKPESTETCTICELLVNELKSELQDKKSEAEIAAVLANACEFLPKADWKDECKGIVKEDLPELIQMLANDINTDTICAVLGLCSGLEDTVDHPPPVKVVNNTCADCIKFFTDVQQTITSNETESQVEQLIDQVVCDSLRGLSSMCKDLVHQYLPLGLQLLADQIDPNTTCRMFGFCTARRTDRPLLVQLPHMKNIFKDRPKTALQYRSSEECDICKSFITSVDDMLRDNTTQELVKSEIEKYVCGSLGALADECKQLVGEYAPLVFELLVNVLDPETFCETIGLCPTPSLPMAISISGVVSLSQPAGKVRTSGVECNICKGIVEELDFFLAQNQTIDAIEDLLDQICGKLPDKQEQDQCKRFVQEYAQMVFDLLKQELDPTVICTALKMCSGRITAELKSLRTSAECTFCVLVLQQIQLMTQNISAQEATKELLLLCTYVPQEFQDQCIKLVTEWVPTIMALLHSKEDPHALCVLIQACPSSMVVRPPYMTKPIPEVIQPKVGLKAGISEKCEICNTVLFFLREMISDNATREEIEQELELVCDEVLPSELKVPCDVFIKTYGDKIILYMLNKTDPYTICKDIRLCDSSSPLDKKTQLATSVIMSPYDFLPLPVIPADIKQEKKLAKPAENGELCSMCTLAISIIESELKTNATKEEIKALLDDLCSQLPSSLTQECNQLVAQYADEIIDGIIAGFSPAKICSEIGLCGAGKRLPVPIHVQVLKDSQEKKLAKPAENGELCEGCKMVMVYLESELKTNATREEIKALLDGLCSQLPSSLTQECNQLVDKYADEIIDDIIAGLSPNVICSDIGLCGAGKRMPAPVHVHLLKDNQAAGRRMKSGAECMICEMVMKAVDNLLLKQKTVEAALEEVCSLMPSAIVDECTSFVKTYGDLIIQLLIKDLANPTQVCSKLGLCTTKQLSGMAAVVTLLDNKMPAGKVGGVDECVVCRVIINFMKNVIDENATVAEVEQKLKELCNVLPGTVTAQCNDIVDNYVPAILDLIKKEMDPAKICQGVGLCNNTLTNGGTLKKMLQTMARKEKDNNTLYFKPARPTHMLGEKKCTYGPAYWCAKRENAKKCNMVEHCERTGWLTDMKVQPVY